MIVDTIPIIRTTMKSRDGNTAKDMEEATMPVPPQFTPEVMEGKQLIFRHSTNGKH
jgi:hypothetical protein